MSEIRRKKMDIIRQFPGLAELSHGAKTEHLTHLCRPVRSTFAVRETASLGIMGAPRVPSLNPSETIVL